MVDESGVWAECCELAGWLAERGVLRVSLNHGGEVQRLDARSGDLPRTLFEAPPGSRLTWQSGAAARGPEGWKIIVDPGTTNQV